MYRLKLFLPPLDLDFCLRGGYVLCEAIAVAGDRAPYELCNELLPVRCYAVCVDNFEQAFLLLFGGL